MWLSVSVEVTKYGSVKKKYSTPQAKQVQVTFRNKKVKMYGCCFTRSASSRVSYVYF